MWECAPMLTGNHFNRPDELLTPEEMYRADALAVAAGVPSLTLMENAGRAVAEEIVRRYGARNTLVLCGPGNNGGDGFVCARYLKQWGWPVRVALYGERAKLKGDAAAMAAKWDGEIEDFNLTLRRIAKGDASKGATRPTARVPQHKSGEIELIVDAIFGAGISKDMPEEISMAIYEADVPVVAVDVPSGMDGATGGIHGGSAGAELTVTFFRKKPGHVLLHGRELCGEVLVADIGIPASVLAEISPRTFENREPMRRVFETHEHKYYRGHAVIISGGPLNTGAARLAAQAALKSEAGLVTIHGRREALAVHASHVTAIMLSDADLTMFLADQRKNAVCVGPAAGIGNETRAKVRVALASGASVVLDADALTSFECDPDELFAAIAENPKRAVILTPHEGEFHRLFKGLWNTVESKHEYARKAAEISGAIVVLKGADTVVAHPDGRATINTNAPPWLATAGSGDVLAGIITGLLAQHIDAYQAACAAVWLHGDAANRHGPKWLTAETLVEML
jgi:NAD(P)H-hydrate epimerase